MYLVCWTTYSISIPRTKLIQPWIVQFYLRKSVPGYTNSTWLTVGVGKIVPDLNTIDITIGIWYDFLADRLLFWHYLDINPEIIGHNHLFYRNTDKYTGHFVWIRFKIRLIWTGWDFVMGIFSACLDYCNL